MPWVNIDGNTIVTSEGPTDSVQFKKDATTLTGSANFLFHSGSNTLEVTGDISSSINVSASSFYGDGSNLTGISAAPGGSNTNIQFNNNGSFSGSALLITDGSGSLSASVNISASAFYGGGSNLTSLPVQTYSNATNNRVLTSAGADSINGESSLTFDGSTLAVAGNVTASINISASSFYGDGSNLTSLPVQTYSNATNNRVLTSAGADSINGESSLTFDGSTLAVAGNVTASINISASSFYGDGSNLTGLSAGSPGGTDAELQFNSGSTFSGSSNISYDYTLGLLSYSKIAVRRVPSESETTNFTAGFEMIYPVDSTGSVITATLPGIDPTGVNLVGMTYTIKDVGGSGSTNNIRINPSGSEKIDGGTAATIATDYGSMILTAFSGGAGGEWMIVGTN